jgi:hypothetical protein
MLEQHRNVALKAWPKPPKERAPDRREGMKSDAEDEVELASDDSFPASDPPSWTPVHGIGSSKRRK